MQKPLLSIAVITYNQENYIAKTLDSILLQEHNYDYEIIVGEDNSSDNTKKIIEEYVVKYPDIIKPLYNNPNKGLIQNYFNVIAHCKGKYIMQCAGDDYWLPGKVKTQIKYMENNPDVGMCYGTAYFLDVKTNQFLEGLFGGKCETFQDLMQRNNIPALTVCIKNDVLNHYIENINPKSQNWLMEDYPTWLWVSQNSIISFLDTPFGVYRCNQDSASSPKNFEKRIRFLTSSFEIKEFYSHLYSVEIPGENGFISAFYLCFNKLIENFTPPEQKLMHQMYKKIPKKNFKINLFYFCSMTKFSFRLLILFRDFLSEIKN